MFLSSVLWNFTNAFKAAINDINNGTYGTHGYNLTLAERRHLAAARTKYIPAAVWAQIGDGAEAAIIAGKIKVPVTTTAGSGHRSC